MLIEKYTHQLLQHHIHSAIESISFGNEFINLNQASVYSKVIYSLFMMMAMWFNGSVLQLIMAMMHHLGGSEYIHGISFIIDSCKGSFADYIRLFSGIYLMVPIHFLEQFACFLSSRLHAKLSCLHYFL